jgi:hypothetical protein
MPYKLLQIPDQDVALLPALWCALGITASIHGTLFQTPLQTLTTTETLHCTNCQPTLNQQGLSAQVSAAHLTGHEQAVFELITHHALKPLGIHAQFHPATPKTQSHLSLTYAPEGSNRLDAKMPTNTQTGYLPNLCAAADQDTNSGGGSNEK